MPVYEYECPSCSERFDKLAPARDADRATCPQCGSVKVRRLLSVIAGLGAGREPEPMCGQGACGACS